MENNNTANKSIHVGRNISRFRHLRGLKQETLAEMIGITQQTMSHHEQQRVVNPEILKKVANALKVPEEILRNLEDDDTRLFIRNHTFGNFENIRFGVHVEPTKNSAYDPIDKIVELIEKLLEHEQKKTEKLDIRLSRLEELIKKGVDPDAKSQS